MLQYYGILFFPFRKDGQLFPELKEISKETLKHSLNIQGIQPALIMATTSIHLECSYAKTTVRLDPRFYHPEPTF